IEAQMVIAGPPLSLGYTWKPEPAGSGHQHGKRVFGLVSDNAGVDAKWSLAIRARRFEAAEQNFYGIGNNSVRAGLAPYSLRRNEIGAALNDPLTFWSSIGLTADYITPRTGPAPDAAVNIGKLYNDTTAPGLGSRNDYLRFEPYVDFRLPVRGSD